MRIELCSYLLSKDSAAKADMKSASALGDELWRWDSINSHTRSFVFPGRGVHLDGLLIVTGGLVGRHTVGEQRTSS